MEAGLSCWPEAGVCLWLEAGVCVWTAAFMLGSSLKARGCIWLDFFLMACPSLPCSKPEGSMLATTCFLLEACFFFGLGVVIAFMHFIGLIALMPFLASVLTTSCFPLEAWFLFWLEAFSAFITFMPFIASAKFASFVAPTYKTRSSQMVTGRSSHFLASYAAAPTPISRMRAMDWPIISTLEPQRQ